MTDSELVDAFESCRLPADQLPHAMHVRVAWCYLRRLPLLPALCRFSDGLRRFAAANGKPDRYHATITVACMLLIHERLRESADLDWDAFAAHHADLLRWQPSVLDAYYSPDLLASRGAREAFVLPDLAGAFGTNTAERACLPRDPH